MTIFKALLCTRQRHHPIESLYSFPVTTATNQHQFSGFKKQEFILLQFWRAESKMSFIGLKSRRQQGQFLLETPGESLFLASFNFW